MLATAFSVGAELVDRAGVINTLGEGKPPPQGIIHATGLLSHCFVSPAPVSTRVLRGDLPVRHLVSGAFISATLNMPCTPPSRHRSFTLPFLLLF